MIFSKNTIPCVKRGIEMTRLQVSPIKNDILSPRGHAVSDTTFTLDEYIEREASSTAKHEFHNGKLLEMAIYREVMFK